MTMATTSGGQQPASRTLVVVGFILATLFSGLVTLWVGTYSADQQAKRADKTAQINRFIDAAQAFDPLVVRLVAETRAGKITDETKRSIKANLIQQRSTLESAQSLLSPDQQTLANRYAGALTEADDGLKSATGPLDSRGFAQGAVHVAELRPKLYKALRN